MADPPNEAAESKRTMPAEHAPRPPSEAASSQALLRPKPRTFTSADAESTPPDNHTQDIQGNQTEEPINEVGDQPACGEGNSRGDTWEATVMSALKRYDQDHDGMLNPAEFGPYIIEAGCPNDEVEEAFENAILYVCGHMPDDFVPENAITLAG